MTPVRHVWLTSRGLSVDVRVRRIRDAWIASADTPDGPSLGLGGFPLEAVAKALESFDERAEELLDAVPEELYYWR